MKKLFLFCTAALLIYAVHAAAEEQAASDVQQIPLKDVSAYGMRGTRDIRTLEPEIFDPKVRPHNASEEAKLDKKSLVLQIANYLGSDNPQKPTSARTGFAVMGNGTQALRKAHSVLVQDQKAKHSFPASSPLSLVFFSKAFDYHVFLDQVNRSGNKITIRYFFAPSITDPAPQFARIPLSDLPLGEIEVDMVRVPCPPKYNDPAYPAVEPKWDELVVCRPFKFTINKRS